MEQLEKKLLEIQDLIKKSGLLPSPNVPKAPGVTPPTPPTKPTAPGMVPPIQKNPVDQAQQIKDPSTKKVAVKAAKTMLKTDKNGQWSLT